MSTFTNRAPGRSPSPSASTSGASSGSSNGNGKHTTKVIDRSAAGLREALFEEMESVIGGASSSTRARSVAMIANAILQSVQTELDVLRFKAQLNGGKLLEKDDASLGSLPLTEKGN